jgi:hypothetical protein
MQNLRTRAAESQGSVSKLHGEYRMAAMSGAATLVAAATTTAGHVFVMRVPTGVTKKVNIRYVNVQFATTTAMAAQQPMGYDLIVGRQSTVAYTGGTAIDMFTLTGSQKLRASQDTTLFTVNNVRIATTTGLTVGTQNLDSLPLSQKMFLSPTLGNVADVTLLDARDDSAGTFRSPLTLAADECMAIRNVILMGGTGVGNIIVNVEWDEVTV